MTSPVETLVTSLARASRKGSYYLRGLRGHERDDVIATALAWCWENRAKYDPSETLERWFDGALCESRSLWFGRGKRKKRDAVLTAVEFNERMAELLPDPTAEAAQAESAARELLAAISPEDRMQIYMIARGMYEAGPELKRRLVKLKHLLPSEPERIKVIRAAAAPNYDNAVKKEKAANIDRDLAALSQPSSHGADCPVCWRCSWYMSMMPKTYVRRVTCPADPEVQAAIWAVEERKMSIAAQLQAGTMQFIGAGR